ncbi:MAG: sigma-70 family RNA polymerase sigma factor [Chloroflexi bacterium]|nr:sigma-70 family RNA polymerase sigma factor [Chloroflexota bacterium]
MRKRRRNAPIKCEQAFSQLYSQTHLKVFRYIYSLHGGPQEEVEDITSETFYKAWKARKRFEGDMDAAFGWLLTIAKRLMIDKHRQNISRGVHIEILEESFAASGNTPEEKAMQHELMEKLITSLQSISFTQ